MFSPHPSSRFQKIGISSLIFLSGMGSVFAVAPTTPLDSDGSTYPGGKFSQYFQNLASTNCGSVGVMTGFLSTPYLKGNCVSIGPIIGAFFNGLSPNVAPAGTAITGFTSTGALIFGQASQWVGSVPGNIYYTGGNVGIGTSTPLTKFQVAGETSSTSATSFRSVFGNYGAFLFNNGSDFFILSTNSGSQYGNYNSFRPFRYNFASGSVFLANNALTALDSGNVGIGNTNPTEKLTVNGNAIVNGSGFVTGNLGIGTTTPRTKLQVAGEISSTSTTSFRAVYGNYGAFLFNNGSDFFILSTNSGSQYNTYNSFRPFRYNFASGSVFLANNALTALDTGNVGIGTTTPGAKLDVNGQIVGGFGASAVGGVLDWNDPTNARSGNGYSILLGNTTNGPTPSSNVYYHPFSFEYSSKNGAGNLTQFAIPYNVNSLNAGMYLRTRYSNTWTTWSRIISENTNGNVGIGTTNPGAKLTVQNGAIGGQYALLPSYSNWNQYGVGNGGAAIYNDNNSYQKLMIVGNNSAGGSREVGIWDNLKVNGTTTSVGHMIINNTSPTLYMKDTDHRSAMVHVNSNQFYILRGCGNNDTSWCSTGGRWPLQIDLENNNATFGGSVFASNYYYTSDKRLKKDIAPIVSPLEKIKLLSGYTFAWKDTGAKSVGLIAQEVEKIFPELVGDMKDVSGNTFKTVQYGNLVAPLIESVKELSYLHDQDKKKIEDLKSEVDQMKKDIEFLRSQIKK